MCYINNRVSYFDLRKNKKWRPHIDQKYRTTISMYKQKKDLEYSNDFFSCFHLP